MELKGRRQRTFFDVVNVDGDERRVVDRRVVGDERAQEALLPQESALHGSIVLQHRRDRALVHRGCVRKKKSVVEIFFAMPLVDRRGLSDRLHALSDGAHAHMPDPGYIDRVLFLTERQREQVVKYINELAEDFELQVETASHAVNYFDRYCAQKRTLEAKVQVVASTTLLIAAKFVDRKLPPLSELVKVHRHTVRAEEFAATELDILETLRWDLNVILPVVFYDVMTPLYEVDTVAADRARFFMDLSVYNVSMLRFSPLTIAAAALLITSSHAIVVSGFVPDVCEADVRDCATLLRSYYDRIFSKEGKENRRS